MSEASSDMSFTVVTPAQAGVRASVGLSASRRLGWIPAFAGMTSLKREVTR